MRVSSLIAASTIALLASPSLADQPIASVGIWTYRLDGHLVRSDECVTVDEMSTHQPVRRVDIKPVISGTEIRCTFYKYDVPPSKCLEKLQLKRSKEPRLPFR
ncbi:hypothetical protein ETB97_007418 [Aspergillus alliaceus]|uniref:Uncharacterized protein n=1 Tax=Petromyces alliaceus TaxID=209559 RepID=A0A8H5ZU79_PETAA|nr:hypothetical protein ETB97_007418 [Aspergillus burnettii]